MKSSESNQSELFLKLEQELSTYKNALAAATDQLLAEEISKYPIFVVHQQDIAVGIPMIDRKKVLGNWSINASTLEQFAEKKIIVKDKLDAFKANFKDPDDYYCLFVLSELGANFVFLTR